MKHQIEFEPALSNFLDESFSNGSGDKPKKTKKTKEPKQKKVKKSKTSSRSDDTYVSRSREGSDREDERGTDADTTSSSGSSKPKLTAEQIQQGVDVATQVGGIVSQLPKNQAKKDLKAVCGRRPLLRKKRANWDKCVAEYNQQKNQAPQQQETNYTPSNNKPEPDEKKFYQKPLFIGGVVLVLAVGGFFAYKKFFNKAPVAVPSV